MNDLIDAPKYSDLIFDVGMHKGEDSAFYLQKGFRVVGIEADPVLAQHCRERFKTFIAAGRLILIEGAIVDPASEAAQSKTVSFYRNDRLTEWGTIDPRWVQRNLHKGASSTVMEVEVIDFADILKRHGIPHYMKIDIEGLDMVCVETLKSFRERPDYLSLESDKNSFLSIRREIDALAELGYDAFQAVEQSSIPYTQVAPRPAREGCYADYRFKKGFSGLFGAELDDPWVHRSAILWRYRAIRLGYLLLGDYGLMNRWTFRGAHRLRSAVRRMLSTLLQAPVPGWYDTHARHANVRDRTLAS